MTAGLVAEVEGVSKRFNRRGPRARTLKQLALYPCSQLRRERFWALQDVNLELWAGETVGVIGANGSGKSTLLRLIGGLGRPTRGRITLHRQASAMLSLGSSLNPLLTGRENAVTAGILAGYRHRGILAKLEEIVAFAELEEFFDHPLRTYSDGMRMRLAFSVAISTEPELLLIDEVLSVGDLRFQTKCADRLGELQEHGTTILLASHDEGQVRSLCGRALWLSRGRVQAHGPPDEVYEAYRRSMRAETERRSAAAAAAVPGREQDGGARKRFGTREVEIVGVRIEPPALRAGRSEGLAPIRIEVDLEARVAVDDPIVGVSLHRVSDFTKVLDLSSEGDGVRLGRVEGRRTVVLSLDRLDVGPGSYRFDVGVYERKWSYVYDYHWHAYPLDVLGGAGGFGPARRWLAAEPP